MAHKVKCFYCGEFFDADKEPFEKPNCNRYAHQKCYQENLEKAREKAAKPKKAGEVKCFYCGEFFNKEKEPFKKVNVRRYAHQKCYEENHLPDDDYIEKIYDLIKIKFGEGYNFQAIDRQRKLFIKNNNYTNEGIYRALAYWFEVRNESVEKAGGRIGIIPYVYDDAQKYYENLSRIEDKIETVMTRKNEVVSISINKIEKENKRKGKEIDLNSLL